MKCQHKADTMSWLQDNGWVEGNMTNQGKSWSPANGKAGAYVRVCVATPHVLKEL